MEWASTRLGPHDAAIRQTAADCRQEKTRLANQPGMKFGRGCLKGSIVLPQRSIFRKCEKDIGRCKSCNSSMSLILGYFHLIAPVSVLLRRTILRFAHGMTRHARSLKPSPSLTPDLPESHAETLPRCRRRTCRLRRRSTCSMLERANARNGTATTRLSLRALRGGRHRGLRRRRRWCTR